MNSLLLIPRAEMLIRMEEMLDDMQEIAELLDSEKMIKDIDNLRLEIAALMAEDEDAIE